ncbi:gas vesicle protein GvpL [Haloquadratum walsbyi]|jgi:Gas vesicle synthesis protein GvpL/GvpF.|uniref:Gas vesicle synthesis protein GvpL/GvpF n=1 Tax=Haloquadratum walsbyi J07HQW2 TaxID=1238425 RepID=U1PWL9_9EURY|nr:GvpL/GvpF family gas vesicle protein [Haloquadratum walsbyi]ERG96831.1 MAG: gas vesicle synthesis protein GvpL/GvpF [Haloquadratum walsbyi J07HQW2]
MTDDSLSTADESNSREGEPQADSISNDVDNGRYIYCLVDSASQASGSLSDDKIEVDGIDGSSPVTTHINGDVVDSTGRVGAVVHSCTQTYEAPKLATVQQRILSHQQVVDAAGSVYGTPLPLRFNTVFEGGDESVRTWVHDNYNQIYSALTRLSETWEYRIGLIWDADQFESVIAETDEELQRIEDQQTTAGEGKAFLLDKQYEQRLATLRNERREELIKTLQAGVESLAVEMTNQGSRDVDIGGSSGRDTAASGHEDAGGTTGELIERVAIRIPADAEDDLGDQLDEFVERDGVSVTFTGPWSPYTFAPNIG